MIGQCSICQELFVSQISALHCGHTFHQHCILNWLERSKTCPQCRGKASEKNLINQLYFDKATCNTNLDQSTKDPEAIEALLNNKISDLEGKLISKESRSADALAKCEKLKAHVASLTSQITTLRKRISDLTSSLHALRVQNGLRNDLEKEKDKLKDELAKCHKKLKSVQAYERILQQTDAIQTGINIEEISNLDSRDANNIITALKRAYDENKKERNGLMDKMRRTHSEKEALSLENRKLMRLAKELREEVKTLSKSTPFNPRLAKFVKNSPADIPDLSLMNDSKDSPCYSVTPYSDRVSSIKTGAIQPASLPELNWANDDILPATPRGACSRKKVTSLKKEEEDADLFAACYQSPKLFASRKGCSKPAPIKSTSTNGMGGPALPPLRGKRQASALGNGATKQKSQKLGQETPLPLLFGKCAEKLRAKKENSQDVNEPITLD